MENNEISMYIEVKVDISDRKKESRKLKNWSKCLVKVEAIKSFPCFLRVTVVHNTNNDWQNLCVPIHVPGVQIRLTNSRSKIFCYGLTWKDNRKRSYVFFAFDSDISFERHMRWLKESLNNLELHRREILDTRRRSRDNYVLNAKRKLSIKDNKTLRDILGPLPKIPDKRDSMNLSKRLSAISGIYEEITDSEKIRRISQTSGIYEEMKPPMQTNILDWENKYNSPPELPIRSRINTFGTDFFQFIKRCNTNPDTIMVYKKDFLQNIHNISSENRSKRSESVSEYKVCTTEGLIDKRKTINCLRTHENKEEMHIYQNFNNFIKKSKDKLWFNNQNILRISISSPDLSKIKNVDILNIKNSKFKSLSASDIYNITNFSENTYDKQNKFKFESVAKNTSDLQDQFNFANKNNGTLSFFKNTSRKNLIGSRVNTEKMNVSNCLGKLAELAIDDVSGYCTMIPIKSKCKCSEKNFNRVSDGSKNVNHCQNLINSNKENYANFFKMKENNETDLRSCKNNSITNYEDSNLDLLNKDIQHYFTPKKSLIDIDEKISSYYHNFDTKQTDKMKNNKFLDLKKKTTILGSRHCDLSNTKNSVYILSPKKKMKQKTEHTFSNNAEINNISQETQIPGCEVVENIYSVKKSINDPLKESVQRSSDQVIFSSQLLEEPVKSIITFESLLQSIDFKFDDFRNNDLKNENHLKLLNSNRKPLIRYNFNNRSSKYDNDISHEKKFIENKIRAAESSSIKKITILPRFKKIDFSPLKTKISNVLQRNFVD